MPTNFRSADGTTVDDGAVNIADLAVQPIAGVYKASRDAVDDGDAGAVAITATRALIAAIETPNGDTAMDDVNDAVRVNLVAGGGSGGTSMTDDAAFTPGSTGVTPVAGTYRSVRDSLDDNDGGAIAITQKRAVWAALETDTGDSAMDDTNNAVRVNIVAGGGSGGTSMTDDAAFTAGSTAITPAGGTYRSVRDALDDNDGGAIALTAKRGVYTTVETPNGDSAMDDTNDCLKASVVVALPAGTNAIGKLVANSGVDIGDVDILSIAAGDNNIGNVDVVTVPAPLSTTGGGTEAAALRVTVASDSTGVLSVDDNAGSLTVDGSVSLAAAVPAGTNNIGDVDVLSVVGDNADLDSGVGTDNHALVAVGVAASGGHEIIGGDAANGLDVDVTRLPALVAGSAIIGKVGIDQTTPGTTNRVDIGAALPAGTNAIGKLVANTGVDIGDVDILSIAAGDNNIGNVDIVAGPTGASALAVQGTVAHDGIAANNPVLLGAKAVNAEPTAVANADVAMLLTDLTGKLINLPYANPENALAGKTASITGTADTAVITAQGAGVRIYVTQVLVTNGHATVGTYVNIKDGTTAIYTGYAAAAGGGFSVTFPVPLRLTANTALNAANETTGSDVRVSASGYKGA